MTHILLVDDHAIVRSGLRRLLALELACEISEAASAREAFAAVAARRPDLMVLDLNLPGLGGLELLRRFLLEDGALRVLVLSMHAEPLYATRALEAGARGYVSKNAAPGEIVTAVQRVAGGGRYIEAGIAQAVAIQATMGGPKLQHLSERDLEMMRMLAAGSSLQQIADSLGIAYKTVANGCTQLKVKLGVSRMADLVRLAVEFGVT